MCLGIKCASVLQLRSGLSDAMGVLFHRRDRIVGSWHTQMATLRPSGTRRHDQLSSAQMDTEDRCTESTGIFGTRVRSHNFNYHEAFFLFTAFQRGFVHSL